MPINMWWLIEDQSRLTLLIYSAVIMSTAELAGVFTRSLGNKVTSLKNKRDKIINALDLLFAGI